MGVEGGSCLRKGTAETVEVGMVVIVEVGNRARREAVGMIGLAWLFSMRKAEDCHAPYLVEDRYGFQEAHWEVL